MREPDAELPDVRTALVRPDDAADHLDRLSASGVVQLATKHRTDLGQNRRPHREPTGPHIDSVGFELLMETFRVELDQNLVERHARLPRCLIITRGCVHRMLSCATVSRSHQDWSQNCANPSTFLQPSSLTSSWWDSNLGGHDGRANHGAVTLDGA